MSSADYYRSVAARYQERFTKGPLRRLRNKERRAVTEALSPQAGDTILDAGCGTGFDAVPLMKAGCDVYGVDLSAEMVEVARERGVNADVANLETFDLGREFDKVLCCGALEFCPKPEAALGRMAKHVRPGGMLVLLYPIPSISGYAYKVYHRLNRVRITLFSNPHIRQLVSDTGLTLDSMTKPAPFTGVLVARRPRSAHRDRSQRAQS